MQNTVLLIICRNVKQTSDGVCFFISLPVETI